MHRSTVLATCFALAVVGALGARPAGAHPTSEPGACTVTIVRAPAAVRAEIDRWVASERNCKTTLELRVVATDGGFYLWARDSLGREHERVVPDAQTAGVLVASWVADDSFVIAVPLDRGGGTIGTVDPFASSGSPRADPFGSGGTAGVRDPFGPPGAGVVGGVAVDPFRPFGPFRPFRPGVVASGEGAGGRGRFAFTLGALVGPDTRGVRGSLEVRMREDWSLVLGLAVSQTEIFDAVFYDGAGDINASAAVAHRWSRGSLHLQLQAGAGITNTADRDFRNSHGIFPTLEGAALAGVALGDWELVGGPVITAFARRVGLFAEPTEASSEVRTMIFGGLRRRL